MTHHTDPRRIEDDIAHDRAQLAATLDALQDRVSVDSLAQDALGLLRTHAADYTHAIDRAVRANPLAVGLVGAGLAWLVFGHRTPPAPLQNAKLEAMSTWEDDGGPARPSDQTVANGADKSTGFRHHSASNGTAGFAPVRRTALAAFADGFGHSLMDGFDNLQRSAKDQTVTKRATIHTTRAIEDYPLVTGTAMLALGAALGTALPPSQIEDQTFGPLRDRLMDDVTRLLTDESAALGRMAGDISADIAASAFDTRHSDSTRGA
jgi:hypothetical protein